MKTLLRITTAALLLMDADKCSAVKLAQRGADVYPFYAYAEMETEESEAMKA